VVKARNYMRSSFQQWALSMLELNPESFSLEPGFLAIELSFYSLSILVHQTYCLPGLLARCMRWMMLKRTAHVHGGKG